MTSFQAVTSQSCDGGSLYTTEQKIYTQSIINHTAIIPTWCGPMLLMQSSADLTYSILHKLPLNQDCIRNCYVAKTELELYSTVVQNVACMKLSLSLKYDLPIRCMIQKLHCHSLVWFMLFCEALVHCTQILRLLQNNPIVVKYFILGNPLIISLHIPLHW